MQVALKVLFMPNIHEYIHTYLYTKFHILIYMYTFKRKIVGKTHLLLISQNYCFKFLIRNVGKKVNPLLTSDA